MTYPNDARTAFIEQNGPGAVQVLPAGVHTILGVSIQQSGTASQSQIECGAGVVAKNYGKDFPFNFILYPCNDVVRISKTGQDAASFVITYVNRDLSHENISVAGSVEIASASALAMGNSVQAVWVPLVLIVMLLAVQLGTYMFKK